MQNNPAKYSEKGMPINKREVSHDTKENYQYSCDITNTLHKGLNLDGTGHTDFAFTDTRKIRNELSDSEDMCEESPFLDRTPKGPHLQYSTPLIKSSISNVTHQKKKKLKQTKIMFDRIG
jgi:hypothetical protein